jgi:CheY-like chemotaxis protein
MTEKSFKKILVIDDDPNTVRLVQKWCANAGYEVLRALNGEEGLAQAKADQPALILLDLMLPDIGGVEVSRRLKAGPLTKDIPVIFITVTLGVEVDKGDETLEVDGIKYRIFAKPLHVPKLLAEIRKSINRKVHGNASDIKGS